MNNRLSSAATVTLMLMVLLFAPLASSIQPAQTDEGEEVAQFFSPGPREYPNGWTHRPVVEVFTSLSCPPCMSNSEPQVIALQEMLEESGDQPFTVITFHQTNGGAGDDATASQEAKDRYNHYSPLGTPDGEIDGGYIQSQDLYASLEEAGQRSVAPTALDVWQTYNAEGVFTLTANLTYFGDGFNPDFTDPGSIIDELGGDELNYEVHLFMIEHDVYAYSSEHEGMVVTPMVYRGSAGAPFTGTLGVDEHIMLKADWAIPSEINHPDGHATPGVQPLDPAIIPGNIEVVAVVYDLDDESKSSYPNAKQGLARAINSATPTSTASDAENAKPTVVNVEESVVDGEANIMAFFSDEDGIGTAAVFYNYESANYTGEWESKILEVQGDEICDEQGVCYAYGDATGIGSIPAVDGKPLYYQLAFADGKQNYNTDDVRAFGGGEAVIGGEAGLNYAILGAIAFVILAMGGFVIWARMPYTGSYFD